MLFPLWEGTAKPTTSPAGDNNTFSRYSCAFLMCQGLRPGFVETSLPFCCLEDSEHHQHEGGGCPSKPASPDLPSSQSHPTALARKSKSGSVLPDPLTSFGRVLSTLNCKQAVLGGSLKYVPSDVSKLGNKITKSLQSQFKHHEIESEVFGSVKTTTF